MAESNPFALLPDDIKKKLLCKYFDGPSAYAMMRATKVMSINLNLSIKTQLKIRLLPESYYIYNEYEKLCIFCENEFGGSCCYLKKLVSDYAIPWYQLTRCEACDTVGKVRFIQPWYINQTMHLRCFKCESPINNNNWIGKYTCCIECGVLCDKCAGHIRQCKCCSNFIKTSNFENHLKLSCVSTSFTRSAMISIGFKYCNECNARYINRNKHYLVYHHVCPKCKTRFISTSSMNGHICKIKK